MAGVVKRNNRNKCLELCDTSLVNERIIAVEGNMYYVCKEEIQLNHFEYMEQQGQMTIFDLLPIQEKMVQGELSTLN